MRIAPTFRRRAAETGGSATRRKWFGVAAAIVAGVALVSIGLAAGEREQSPTGDESLGQTTSTPRSQETSLAGTGPVEVPNVVGSTLAQARIVLGTAGLAVELMSESDVSSASAVTAQKPVPGTLAQVDTTVTLATSPAQMRRPKPAAGSVVVIDPGHQAHSDSSPEPIGPGAKDTKPAVTGGTTGIETGIPEYEVVLQISMNLRKRLEAAGVKVVMTRTTNDVNLSNSQRAAIANKAGADIFVRIHADGSPNSDRSGISTLYPASNRWTNKFWKKSRAVASAVQAGAVKNTGAVNLGVVPRGDISGFNYATMPSVLVECGFMSNPVEDRLLASPHYQDKLAKGIAEGIISSLDDRGR